MRKRINKYSLLKDFLQWCNFYLIDRKNYVGEALENYFNSTYEGAESIWYDSKSNDIVIYYNFE